jgi:hypothetical protein
MEEIPGRHGMVAVDETDWVQEVVVILSLILR